MMIDLIVLLDDTGDDVDEIASVERGERTQENALEFEVARGATVFRIPEEVWRDPKYMVSPEPTPVATQGGEGEYPCVHVEDSPNPPQIQQDIKELNDTLHEIRDSLATIFETLIVISKSI